MVPKVVESLKFGCKNNCEDGLCKRLVCSLRQGILKQYDMLIAQSPDNQIFSIRYPVTCKDYTWYHAVSEIKYGVSACTFNSPLTNTCELSLPTDG